jgi:hypothetical protein
MKNATTQYLMKRVVDSAFSVNRAFRWKDSEADITVTAVPRTPTWRDVPAILAGRYEPQVAVVVDQGKYVWNSDHFLFGGTDVPDHRTKVKDVACQCPLPREERLEDYRKRQQGSDHGVSTLLERYAVAQLAGILSDPDTKK